MSINRTKPRVRRSAKWEALSKRIIAKHPYCAVCGNTTKRELRGHHKVPVHVDPSRELDEANVVVLCQGKTVNCHLLVGHLMSWRSWNVAVDSDIARLASAIQSRPMLAQKTQPESNS